MQKAAQDVVPFSFFFKTSCCQNEFVCWDVEMETLKTFRSIQGHEYFRCFQYSFSTSVTVAAAVFDVSKF